MSAGLTELERRVLDEFRQLRHPRAGAGDMRGRNVAARLGVPLPDVVAAIGRLGDTGHLVVARIMHADGAVDMQARLAAMPPRDLAAQEHEPEASAAAPPPDEPAIDAPFRSRRQLARAADADRDRPTSVPPRIAQQAAAIRVGLFSDGSMQLSRGEEVFSMAPEETRSLFAFLDRFSGLAEEAAS